MLRQSRIDGMLLWQVGIGIVIGFCRICVNGMCYKMPLLGEALSAVAIDFATFSLAATAANLVLVGDSTFAPRREKAKHGSHFVQVRPVRRDVYVFAA